MLAEKLLVPVKFRSHRRGDWKSSVSKVRLLRTKDCLQSDEEIALRWFSLKKFKVGVGGVWGGKD